MAKHLTDMDIQRIVEVIDGCTGKLTWDWLCDNAVKVVGKRPTRQSLNTHTRIKSAFKNKKERLKSGAGEIKTPPSLTVAAQRIKRLEEENARLKKENELFLEQFVVWQYNAHRRGLSEAQLNDPLPVIDRDSSELDKA